MNPDFGLEKTVSAFAVHLEGSGLDTCALAFEPVRNYCFEPVSFGPPQVHAEKHFRPILAFGTTCAGMDRDNCAPMIVFAGQQHAGFEFVDGSRKIAEFAFKVRGNVLALAQQFKESIEIGDAAAHLPVVLDRLLETFPVLHYFLAAFRGIPEFGGADFFFCFLELATFGGRVKDSPARLQLAGGA
jgi:hypothetical protein